MKENIILTKTYNFALSIVKLYNSLAKEEIENTISQQILKKGISIGSNAIEAAGSHSKKISKSKFLISHREAEETHYWIRLLKDSGYINNNIADSLLMDIEEILMLLEGVVEPKNTKTYNNVVFNVGVI